MKQLIIPACLLSLLLTACGNSKEKMLTGKWQAVKLDKAALDKQLEESRLVMDTIGTHTTPEMNQQLYGHSNPDTLKAIISAQIDESRLMQQYFLDHTSFEFRKDKIAVLIFGGEPDSASWYFDDEGALVLDDMKLKGSGDKTKMEIVSLTDTTLQLRYTENGVTSVASFRAVK
jgi:hypothetical protein